MIGTAIIIEGIKFKILSLDVLRNTTSISGFGRQVITVPISNEIKMIAETTTNYYTELEKWRDDMFTSTNMSKPASSYKKTIKLNNYVHLIGVFPISYSIEDNNIINVTFSIDYIDGNINLFKLKQMRKEKLEKLNIICQSTSQ